MGNEITIQDCYNQMDRIRRSNNWGNAMVASSVNTIKRDMRSIERDIIGSSVLMYSSINELASSNQAGFESMVASTEGLRSDISLASYALQSSLSLSSEKIQHAVEIAEKKLTTQIQLSTAKLQLSLDNIQSSVEISNKILADILQEGRYQTSILRDINEGIHEPYIQEINNGIEDYNLRNYESAENSFNRALNIRKSLFLAHYYLGLMYKDDLKTERSLFNLEKAEKELKDAIFYGEKIFVGNRDVESYMVLAHRELSDVFYKQESCDNALKELEKGISLSTDQNETKIMYVENYVHCYYKLGNKKKALEYSKFGLESDATYVSLLCDPEIEELWDDIFKQIQDCNVSFEDVIFDLLSKVKNPDILVRINKLISEGDAKTYLGRHRIISLLKEGLQL